jgi:hypothetical protein
MNINQIKNQFSKYIRKIILPKYEDIMDFEIEISRSQDKKKLNIKFIFEMDGTEHEIEQKIIENVHNMVDLFGMEYITYWFKFDTL